MRRALLVLAMMAAATGARADDAADPDLPSLVLFARQGQPAELVRQPKVKVGEPFHVVVTATARADVLVNLPASFDTGDFEVVERKETATADGTEKTFDLTVVGWKPGALSLPGIPVDYVSRGKGDVKQARTTSLDVEVAAVLADPEQAQLSPLAPPVDVYVEDWTLVYVAGGVGGALVLGGVGWAMGRLVARRRRRLAAAVAAAVDARPPHEVALERLAQLERSGRLDEVDRRPYYFELTEILRAYLGRRFGFDALDMTSTELVEALGRSPAGPEVGGAVEGWLAGCDLVKYARVPVPREEGAAALAAARVLVERSTPPPPVAEAARA
jgi:hypothetical protein